MSLPNNRNLASERIWPRHVISIVQERHIFMYSIEFMKVCELLHSSGHSAEMFDISTIFLVTSSLLENPSKSERSLNILPISDFQQR